MWINVSATASPYSSLIAYGAGETDALVLALHPTFGVELATLGGEGLLLQGRAPLQPGSFHQVIATYAFPSTWRLFVDGLLLGTNTNFGLPDFGRTEFLLGSCDFGDICGPSFEGLFG
jgi:hypothetical protein